MIKKNMILAILTTIGVGGSIWYFASSKTDLYAYVPQKSIFVGKVSFVSLFEKLSFKDIKDYEKIADFMENNVDPEAEKLLLSAIEFNTDPVVFANKSSGDNMDNLEMGVLMAVKNESDVKKLIEQFAEMSATDFTFRGEELKISYPTNENKRQMAFAWNNDILILALKPNGRINIKSFADQVLDSKKGDNIFKNKSFSEFKKNSSDIAFFLNMDQLLKDQEKDIPKSVNSIVKPLNGISFHLNFEDNAANFDLCAYSQDSKIGSFLNEKIDAKYLDYISSNGKAIAMLGANLKMKEIIKLAGKDESFDKELNNNTDLKNLMNALTGEFVMAFSGVREIQTEVNEYDYYSESFTPVKKNITIPIYTIQVGTSNPAKIKEMLQTMTNSSDAVKVNNELYTVGEGEKMAHVLVKSDRIIISSDPKTANLKNNDKWPKPTNENFKKGLSENPIFGIISLNPDDYPFIPFKNTPFKDLMQDITISSQNEKDILRIRFSLNLKNGQGNSLYRIIKGMLDLNLNELEESIELLSGITDNENDYDEPVVEALEPWGQLNHL